MGALEFCSSPARPFPAVRLSKSHSNTSRCRMRAVKATDRAAGAELLESVADIPPQYKGILLDQFGVLHDGKHAYPGAVEAVRRLAEAGRKLLILSNSSRRATNTIPRLEKLGFAPEHFSGAVTSGELTYVSLEGRPDDWWQRLGRKCLHLSWGSRGAVSLAGLGLEVTTDPKAADFVLAHGTEVLGRGDGEEPKPADMGRFEALLQCTAERGIPLIVANPDVVTVSGNSLIPMPGTFARWYRKNGGEVRQMGKPDPVIYKAAMEMMGLASNEVLAVGDSLEHDISGAAAAGIDALFVLGGIHAEELGISASQLEPDLAKLNELCKEHHSCPQFLMPFLR